MYGTQERVGASSDKQESPQSEEPTTKTVCGEAVCCNNLQDCETIEVEVNGPEGKKWYASKTLWVLAIGAIGEIALVATETLPLTPEAVSVLTFINATTAALLRIISKEKLTF